LGLPRTVGARPSETYSPIAKASRYDGATLSEVDEEIIESAKSLWALRII
jgi:hypothetical protein